MNPPPNPLNPVPPAACPFCGRPEVLGNVAAVTYCGRLEIEARRNQVTDCVVCEACGGFVLRADLLADPMGTTILPPAKWSPRRSLGFLARPLFAASRATRIGRRWTQYTTGARLSHCVRCACRDLSACAGGCFWVSDGLCSRCATLAELKDAGVAFPQAVNTAFSGEVMICFLCGASAESKKDTRSNWRVIDVDSTRFYFCPSEFPPDGCGAAAFKEAYRRAVRPIYEIPIG